MPEVKGPRLDPSLENEQTEIREYLDCLLRCAGETAVLDFCRKRLLHGTPKIFRGREDAYYDFRKRVADEFNVNFHEVFIIGSAKLGFSPHKQRPFSYDSDVDVAIVSTALYERIMGYIHEYQMQLRENRKAVTDLTHPLISLARGLS